MRRPLSHNFAPERQYCTAGECLEEAIVVGHATLRVNPWAGALTDERLQRFTLPLCTHHAYLLRLTNTLAEFDSGAQNRDRV